MDPDDDLLQPSLTTADDAVGFDAPWNPGWLTFAAFLGGLGAGGWLLADNWRRLGHPEKARALFWPLAILWLAGVAATTWLHLAGWPGWYTAGSDADRRAVRFYLQILTVAIAVVVSTRQQPRWRIWTGSGGGGAKLLLPAIGAIGRAAIVQIAVVWALCEAYLRGILPT